MVRGVAAGDNSTDMYVVRSTMYEDYVILILSTRIA